jgi:hypothetical protein
LLHQGGKVAYVGCNAGWVAAVSSHITPLLLISNVVHKSVDSRPCASYGERSATLSHSGVCSTARAESLSVRKCAKWS